MDDSLSPRGREAQRRVKNALEVLGEKNGVKHVWADKNIGLPVDGFLVIDDKVAGVFEAKSRKAAFQPPGLFLYDGKEYESYMITEKKIKEGVKYSKDYGVPFVILVLCELSGHVLTFRVTDSEGNIEISYKSKRSTTRATINGGYVERLNAFIPIKGQEDGVVKVWPIQE